MSPIPTRRSSRIHTSTQMNFNLHKPDSNHSRNTRRTTQTIGTLSIIPNRTQSVQSHPSSTISRERVTPSSQTFGNTNTRTSKRARPRWYRPPPPEAYLIIRAHRRPMGGWCEDWSKKGDGWYVPLFSSHPTIIHRIGADV